MAPRYQVTLTEQERQECEALKQNGKTNAERFLFARALLLCDAGPSGPAWSVADTAEALDITPRTVEHLKKCCFVEDGLAALHWSVDNRSSHCESRSLMEVARHE